MSDSKETHKASFTVQASVKIQRTSAVVGFGLRFGWVVFASSQSEIKNQKSKIVCCS
jgi:hypothetical protein